MQPTNRINLSSFYTSRTTERTEQQQRLINMLEDLNEEDTIYFNSDPRFSSRNYASLRMPILAQQRAHREAMEMLRNSARARAEFVYIEKARGDL